jgi:AAA ATPase domain
MSVSLFQALETSIRQSHPNLPLPPAPAPTRKRPEASDTVVTTSVTAALRKAAVLTWLSPAQLVADGDRAVKERVLSALVDDCDVGTFGSRVRWCLRRDARRRTLSELVKDSSSMTQLLRETESFATESDARLLRRVLSGKSIDPARVSTEDRPALLRVAEWTDGIFPTAPTPSDVRGLLARDAIKESLNVLVGRFRGRGPELRALHRFVFAKSGTTGNDRVPVLALSGVGGAGKSALLSKFTDRLIGARGGARSAVVLIDFDRARFSSGDPVALTLELTRQIGAWFPSLAEPMRKVRHSARTNLYSSTFAAQNMRPGTLESVGRSETELISTLPRILKNAGIGTHTRPLVIVLDTLEVLQAARGDTSIDEAGARGPEAVWDWVSNLFFSGGLQVRVLIAGRAPIAEDGTFGPMLTHPELHLTGVDRTSALALLRDDGVRVKDARLLLDALEDPADRTVNPLMMRLAARLVKTGTVRPDLLKRDVRRGRKTVDQELVQGVLYKRILAHIGGRKGDETLGALAHPGLVLRRVTPDNIARVLIPVVAPKLKGKVSPTDLFDRLRREVWLVRQTGPQTVEHRTDLRRTMLRLIDRDMRSQARKIHRAAIKYYRAGGEANLNTDVAAGEALYHRLMLMNRVQAARLSPAEIRRYESTLLPNLDDLPAPVRTVVKSIIDRPMSDKDGLALPEPRRTEFILKQGERCVGNDEPARALALLESTHLHPLWELQALAMTVQWQAAKERGLLVAPDTKRDPNTNDGALVDRINLIGWLCFCLGDAKAAYQCEAKLLDLFGPGRDWPEALLEPVARGMTYQALAERIAGLYEPRLPPIHWSVVREERLGVTSIALEATRQAVLAAFDEKRKLDCRLVFSGEALPPSIKLLETLGGVQSPVLKRRLSGVLTQLLKLPKRASSGEVLGTVARAFPKAVVVDPARWPELREHWRLVCPNPEFRAPVRFALLEVFRTEHDLAILSEIAWSLVDLHPHDLDPKVLVTTAMRRKNPGAEIAKLVLYIDRVGALGQLLRMARKEKPNGAKLAMVSDAVDRWEGAISRPPL